MNEKEYISWEYKEITVRSEQASFYLDSYENFGWQEDERFSSQEHGGRTVLKLKRNRKLVNKVELTRLQRHFEADMEEIDALEQAKTTKAKILALSIGTVGTAFMAGSVFAVTAASPLTWLSILLAVPAFAGWIAPYFVYRKVKAEKTKEMTGYINAKYEEIDELCEKGHSLL